MSRWSPEVIRVSCHAIEAAEYKLILGEIAKLIVDWHRQKQTVSAALDTPKQKEIES